MTELTYSDSPFFSNWSQTYFTNLTLDEHIANNNWILNTLTMLKDDGVLSRLIILLILYIHSQVIFKEDNFMAKELTNSQRDELIEQFVEIQLDNMDTQSLYELASEYVTQSFDRLTDNEIKERIESLYDEELYDELVDNVTSEDSNCMQTFIPGFHD